MQSFSIRGWVNVLSRTFVWYVNILRIQIGWLVVHDTRSKNQRIIMHASQGCIFIIDVALTERFISIRMKSSKFKSNCTTNQFDSLILIANDNSIYIFAEGFVWFYQYRNWFLILIERSSFHRLLHFQLRCKLLLTMHRKWLKTEIKHAKWMCTEPEWNAVFLV